MMLGNRGSGSDCLPACLLLNSPSLSPASFPTSLLESNKPAAAAASTPLEQFRHTILCCDSGTKCVRTAPAEGLYTGFFLTEHKTELRDKNHTYNIKKGHSWRKKNVKPVPTQLNPSPCSSKTECLHLTCLMDGPFNELGTAPSLEIGWESRKWQNNIREYTDNYTGQTTTRQRSILVTALLSLLV